VTDPNSGERARVRGAYSGARYADRYFGAARSVAEPETIDLVAGEVPAQPPDETGTDPRAPVLSPWHAHPVARATVVGALIVGALGGAYGLEQWRDREADLAARAAVDITSDVTMRRPGQDTIALSVQLHNEGPYPVTLTGLDPGDPRLTVAEGDFDAIDIEPGAMGTALVTFDYDCDAAWATEDDERDERDERDDAVVAHLRAVDGSDHDRDLSMAGLGVDFASFMSSQCGWQARQPTFSESYPELLDATPLGEDAVAASVLFHMGPGSPLPNIVDVQAGRSAFVASWDGDFFGHGEAGSAAITVTWTVGDCEAALVADEYDMVLRVTGQLPADDRTTTISAPPSTGLVAELVRLTERTCR